MKAMPFFMTNEDWYTVDSEDDDRGYKLTDKAPQEAIDSYNEFYGGSVVLEGEAQEAFSGYVFD